MSRVADRDRNRRILVIEDSRGDALLLDRAFRRSGLPVEIIIAASGEQALTLLHSEAPDPSPPLPDIMLLDLNLPFMSGIEFLCRVKEDQLLRCVPVLVLSSSTADTDVVKCYRNHANGYIEKPFDMAGYDLIAANIERCWFSMMHMTPDQRSSRGADGFA